MIKLKDLLNEIKSIYDYLIIPPKGTAQEKIVKSISKLKSKKDEVYRGVSHKEYKNLLKNSKVISLGKGNTRKGIVGSYVTSDIQLAGRFAFTEYKDSGIAYIFVIDRYKLPDLNPADTGNYWTSEIPLNAIKTVYNIKDFK
jgi:hypothetical protein